MMFALYHRDVHGGAGQVIDVSLFESLFSLLGPLPAEYRALGRLRGAQRQPIEERRPARLLSARATAAASPSADRRRRWPSGSCRPTASSHLLAGRPRFGTNEARVRHAAELDEHVACGDRVAHARREPAHHRRAMTLTAVAVQTVADIEQRSALARAPAARGCAERHGHGADAQRRAAPVGDAGRRFATPAARSARTTTPSTATSLACQLRRARQRCGAPASFEYDTCEPLTSDQRQPCDARAC